MVMRWGRGHWTKRGRERSMGAGLDLGLGLGLGVGVGVGVEGLVVPSLSRHSIALDLFVAVQWDGSPPKHACPLVHDAERPRRFRVTLEVWFSKSQKPSRGIEVVRSGDGRSLLVTQAQCVPCSSRFRASADDASADPGS